MDSRQPRHVDGGALLRGWQCQKGKPRQMGILCAGKGRLNGGKTSGGKICPAKECGVGGGTPDMRAPKSCICCLGFCRRFPSQPQFCPDNQVVFTDLSSNFPRQKLRFAWPVYGGPPNVLRLRPWVREGRGFCRPSGTTFSVAPEGAALACPPPFMPDCSKQMLWTCQFF